MKTSVWVWPNSYAFSMLLALSSIVSIKWISNCRFHFEFYLRIYFASIIHLYGREKQARLTYCFPIIPQRYRYKTTTKAVHIRYFCAFRRPEKRESKVQAVKGLPAQGRAGILYSIAFFSSPSKLLRAFDRQSRSPTIPKPKGTEMSCKSNEMR